MTQPGPTAANRNPDGDVMSFEAIGDEALAEAAAWHAELRDGRASPEWQRRWRQWLNARPQHQAAWREVQAVTQSFAAIASLPDPESVAVRLEAVRQRMDRRIARRRVLLGMAALGGAGALGWQMLRQERLPGFVLAWAADHRTATGERREITLPDDGALWLDTASAVDVAYTPSLRRVTLRSGRILVDTAPDPLGRPFVVDTDLGRLRALGTRFDVHRQDDAIALAVYEGRVEIRTADDAAAIVPAGRQAHFTARRIAPPREADATAQAWSRGLLVAHDMPLFAVVAELQRYRRGQLVLAPELAHVLVYGSFPLDDTDKALNMLARTLRLCVRRPLPWRTVIEPA